MNASFIELAGRLIMSALVGVIFVTIAKTFLTNWASSLIRWKYPDIEKLRNLIDDEEINRNKKLRNILVDRYNSEAFYIATGIRLHTIDDMPLLFDKERELKGKFGWQTLRKIYPIYLRPSQNSLNIIIPRNETIIYYIFQFVGLYVILLFGTLFFSKIDDGRDFLIVAGWGILFLLPVLLFISLKNAAYNNAKSVKKYQDTCQKND